MKKFLIISLLIITTSLFSQETIGYDKFKLGMSVPEVRTIIQNDYSDWGVSTEGSCYVLVNGNMPRISLYFLTNDNRLSQISLFQEFADAKSAKSEHNRLINILNKKYGKAKFINKAKTFTITQWANNDYQHIQLRYVAWADRDMYYYELSYLNFLSSEIIKANSKSKTDDSGKF